MTPYRRSGLWAPADQHRGRRALRGVLLICGSVGLSMWFFSPAHSLAPKAKTLVDHLAIERYTEWHAEAPKLRCPHRLGDLGGAVLDPWGHAMHYTCDHRLMRERANIEITSAGQDGVFGTADDLRSEPGVVVISAGEDGVFGTADDVRSTP